VTGGGAQSQKGINLKILTGLLQGRKKKGYVRGLLFEEKGGRIWGAVVPDSAWNRGCKGKKKGVVATHHEGSDAYTLVKNCFEPPYGTSVADTPKGFSRSAELVREKRLIRQ